MRPAAGDFFGILGITTTVVSHLKKEVSRLRGLATIPFHIAGLTGDAPSTGDASPVGIHVSIHVSHLSIYYSHEETIWDCMKLN